METDDLIGERLGGFRIVALLGKGAMARVYRARQDLLNREVALKVIRRIPGDTADSAARFQREKTVLQKLDHPHIMPIYDYAANAEYLWIASPLVEGGTLEDRLKQGPLSLSEVVKVVNQLGGAVDEADDRGVVHRDIKPSNVMIDRQESGDHFYLTDFGVAKLLEAEGLTAPGTTLGTPEYMSPEQVLGRPMGGPSDQYSLGIMVYQLLSGKQPFTGKMMAVMQAQAKSSPPSLGKTVPSAVEKALFQALAKDPTKRYASCADFARALEVAAGCEAPAAIYAPTDNVEELLPGGTAQVRVLAGDMAAAPATSPPPPVTPKRPWALLIGLPILILAAFGLGRLFGPSTMGRPLLYCQHAGGEDYEIWRRGADGTTRSLGAGLYPHAWPGGKFLLLTAWEGKGKQKLFRVDLSKGERHNLTNSPSAEQSGTVSPDGKSLVYSSSKELYRIDLTSGKSAKLSPGKGQWPSFSPGGNQVAFSCDTEDRGIWLLDLKSKKKRRLTSPEAGEVDVFPAWSPDGQRLVFERERAGTRHLRLVNLDGKEEALAVTGAAGQPSWSPCSEIAYVAEQGILSIAPTGGKPRLLVKAPGGDKELLWPAWTNP